MKIELSQNIQKISVQNCPNTNISFSGKEINDSIELRSKQKKEKNVSFGQGFLKKIFSFSFLHNSDGTSSKPEPSDYAKELSSGVLRCLETEIPPENFECIMTANEFREILPSLNSENFMSSESNIEDGTYFVDLDYQCNYSKGNENIYDILDNAVEYANEYHAKTGKKFIFALTDRDILEGVQHAVRIIGENPEKFKNLKFIPAIKLSYSHKAPNSQLNYENSEMLVYGINPFSQTLINFVDFTIAKRKAMVFDFIKEVYELYPEFAYSIIEFANQNDLKYKRDFTVSNLYWRAREYAETKGDTAMTYFEVVPEEILKEAENIINQLGKVIFGSQQSAYSPFGTNIIKEDSELNQRIKDVFTKYSTRFDETKRKVVSSAENIYSEMINCLSLQSQKPVLALSAPFYLSHYYEEENSDEFPNVVEFIKDLKKDSNGMLEAFESVVPIYDLDSNLTPETIRNFNNYIKENTGLHEVGGSFAKYNIIKQDYMNF